MCSDRWPRLADLPLHVPGLISRATRVTHLCSSIRGAWPLVHGRSMALGVSGESGRGWRVDPLTLISNPTAGTCGVGRRQILTSNARLREPGRAVH